MYEPRQGDLVLVRGHIKCFRQRIDINALTCTRIQNSSEELAQMMLPSILYHKVYSIPAPSLDEFNSARRSNESQNQKAKEPASETNNAQKNIEQKTNEENFISFVFKKITQLSANASESCSSYSVYNFLRNNCPVEFKCVTLKQVLDALKTLEIRGMVYSCEDEFHYLPMN